MSSPAQILANRLNAERSTGPVTAEGKARVSRNGTKAGLFSTVNFIFPEERHIFDDFRSSCFDELAPKGALEHTLAQEIVHAAWRLRRCAAAESDPPAALLNGDASAEDCERFQTSIDRARASAQRAFHRALAELRRVQTECVRRALSQPVGFSTETIPQAEPSKIHPRPVPSPTAGASHQHQNTSQNDFAKQTRSPLAAPVSIARNAPCPCRSGEKYKRCCGKNAPPVLGMQAA